jgi:ABC-2 type transport system ATP-binding protein
MRSLKGETTIFYSTHILEDVERVSDHVAILDQGRLIKTSPTQELLASFARGRLRVVVGGAVGEFADEIAGIPGVTTVRSDSRQDEVSTFTVVTASGATAAVQRSITWAAARAGLTLISNAEETLDLESVFLRLIDQKEVAA